VQVDLNTTRLGEIVVGDEKVRGHVVTLVNVGSTAVVNAGYPPTAIKMPTAIHVAIVMSKSRTTH
jgi:hypothetical protein